MAETINRDYQQEKKRGEISELKLRLASDLQSVYLTEAMTEIHPTILQTVLECFATVAVQRKSDRRINTNRVIEILTEQSH